MELLTNSSKNKYQECPREFLYHHEQGYKPARESAALSRGRMIHECLESYYKNEASKIAGIIATEPDKYKQEFYLAIINGYALRYPEFKEPVAVEKEFQINLINPKTGAKSRTFDLAGKIDVLFSDSIMEHKTTVNDISKPDSNYWLKLTIDPQVTGYFLGAETMGYKPQKIIYDVIGIPNVKPKMATPLNERKYKKTKDGSKGDLYANQRAIDETPEEYGVRIATAIAENPDRYYQRRDLVRIQSDIIEYLGDMWGVGKQIMESRNTDSWPRRPSQCFNMGKCSYYPVCSNMADLNDESMYSKVTKQNEELSI